MRSKNNRYDGRRYLINCIVFQILTYPLFSPYLIRRYNIQYSEFVFGINGLCFANLLPLNEAFGLVVFKDANHYL